MPARSPSRIVVQINDGIGDLLGRVLRLRGKRLDLAGDHREPLPAEAGPSPVARQKSCSASWFAHDLKAKGNERAQAFVAEIEAAPYHQPEIEAEQ